MKFIINLTIREIRSSWRRLLFFFLCIAIGVGSVVALRSLIQNLGHVVGGDARALMTADVEIISSNDFTPTEISAIEKVISQFPTVEARNEAITVSSMAKPIDPANENFSVVELKGIEPPFPLVGNFVVLGKPFEFPLLENRGAVVAPILLEDLNVKVGEKIKIGEIEFQIRGTFEEEPGGANGFRLGPRVFVEKKAFDEAGLTASRGRISRRILYRTADNPSALVKALRDELKGTTLRVRSYRESQERLGEQFARTENYLSLTGLLILVLGGVGVWNVARVFVEQKRKSVAVLKCLGASGTKIITVYILQILTLGFIGSLFGVLLAQFTLWAAKSQFGADLPKEMSYAVNGSTAFQGILLGVLISLLFSALPLLQVRTIKPNLLLRDENNRNLRRLDWTKTLITILSIAGLLGLAVWQAGSLLVGAFFLVGLTITSMILYFAAILLMVLLKRFKNLGSFSLAQAINSLYRPGNQTRIILLAVGLGAFVVLSVQFLQTNLVREFDFSRNQSLPSLFFIDIQKSQVSELQKIIKESTGDEAQAIPTIRARISHINGEPVDFQSPQIRQEQGRIGREFAVTYRPNLDDNETVIAGKWWDNPGELEVPEVSLSEDIADDLKVSIGDSITFDISGKKVTVRISNIRKIDLRNTRTAFVFVFAPGILDQAPQTFVATVVKKQTETERARLQRAIIDSFPNIQIFDVADIVAAVQKLISNFVLAISFVGGFVILSGVLILIGSVALTKSQRIYENAVLKTLGAKRKTLAAILFTEYGLLGFLAGIIGTGFAVLLSFGVSKFILDIEWKFDLALTIYGVFLTAFLVMIIGAIASFSLLFKKPLSTLRGQ